MSIWAALFQICVENRATVTEMIGAAMFAPLRLPADRAIDRTAAPASSCGRPHVLQTNGAYVVPASLRSFLYGKYMASFL